MSLKKLGTALVVVLALGAVMVSSASAAAVTEDVKWYTGSGGTTEVGAKASGVSVSAAATENGILESTVAGTALTLKSTALSCSSCLIYNEGGSAKGSGTIKFENVTVVSPAACKVNGETVTTKPLEVDADFMEGGPTGANLIRFKPAEGATFATIKLEKGTGTCAISGSYNVTGSVFAQSVNKTGVFVNPQGIKLTPTINSNAGGELKLGAELAKLTGAANFSTASTPFGTK